MSFAVNHLSNPISHFTEATKKAASSSSEKLSTGIKKAEDQFKRSNEPTIFHHGEVKPQAKMGLENQSILNAKKETVGHVSNTPDSPHQVEVFDGKGGNLGVRIKSPEGIHYFGIPGSKMNINGEPLPTWMESPSAPILVSYRPLLHKPLSLKILLLKAGC